MRNNKKYQVKSRLRLTMFLTLLVVVTVTSFNTFLGLNEVDGKARNQYITVEVLSGETLWTLADSYMPKDMDKRKAIYIISKANSLDDATLKPGQKIKIPTNNF